VFCIFQVNDKLQRTVASQYLSTGLPRPAESAQCGLRECGKGQRKGEEGEGSAGRRKNG